MEKSENFISKLFVQSSHYVMGTIAVMLAGFISLPILTRVFSRAEYGVLSLISITLWIALAFSKAGLQDSTIRFYGEFKDGKRDGKISVFYTTLLFSAILFAVIVSAILWSLVHLFHLNLFGPDTDNLILIVLILIITGTIFARISGFYRAAQSTKAFNVINVVQRYLSLALALFFLYAIKN